MKRRVIAYMPEELAWIEARKELPRRDLHALFVAYWDRSDVSHERLNSLCKRKGWKTGRTGCFPKGQEPANKGMKMPFNENSARTQFRMGEQAGRAKQLYKPIGTERVSKDGYVERKIHDELPMQSRWRPVHLLRWEEANGPVPAGMCLKNRDGNRTNTDPSNWDLIDRALLPSLNGGSWRGLAYDDAEPEVKSTLMVMAKLRQAKRAAQRSLKQ